MFTSLVVMSPLDGGNSVKHCKDPLQQGPQPPVFNDHEQRAHSRTALYPNTTWVRQQTAAARLLCKSLTELLLEAGLFLRI